MNNKNIRIVYCRTIDYNFDLQQRPHHIMNELANRGYDIRWLNTDYYKGPVPIEGFSFINENLKVYYDWNDFKDKFKHPDIYFSSWSDRYKDLYHIKPKYGVLYDSLDNFYENSKNESDMINMADIVLTTSQSLFKLRKKEHNDVVMCPNGCFPELGEKPYPIPNDLKEKVDMNKPIILFCGALARWCNLKLLKQIASKHQLVFIGKPWNIPIPENLIYLGCKNYSEMQAYYNHCDITLLPFNKMQEAIYSDPIKVYESLVHGKICVSTNIEEACKFDKKTVYTSKSDGDFLQNINRALKQKGNKDIELLCKKEAEKHSWLNRVDIIEEQILKLVNRGK